MTSSWRALLTKWLCLLSVWAAQLLFSTYAPVSLPGVDRLDHGIMRHTVMNGFFLALAKRKAWNIDPAWFIDVESKGWTKMIRVFHSLPTLLDETDRLLAQQAGVGALVAIVARLIDVKAEVSRNYPPKTRPVISASAMDALGVEAEEHVVMADSTTFAELYAPTTKNAGADAIESCFVAMLSLIIECTMLRIWHFRPETLAAASPTALSDAEQSAYSLARELCQLSLSWTQIDKVSPALPPQQNP